MKKLILITTLSLLATTISFADGTGPETISSDANCSAATSGGDCIVNSEATTITLSSESLKIVRADGSVVTLTLVEGISTTSSSGGTEVEMTLFSSTDFVTGSEHEIIVESYTTGSTTFSGSEYSRKIVFKDGNNGGAETVYYGNVSAD